MVLSISDKIPAPKWEFNEFPLPMLLLNLAEPPPVSERQTGPGAERV